MKNLIFAIIFLNIGVTWAQDNKLETATFAGGCFWCMEPPFEKLDGVKEVISGYMGGPKLNPTYEEVSAGTTGHTEIVQISFDPKKVSYEKLLEIFWMNIDPTTLNSQFVDIGSQYRTAIFYHNDEQKKQATQSKENKDKSQKFGKKIVTEITLATTFYRAEEYHQDYYKKNPIRYKYYRHNSGRDQYLEKIWGKK
ncbi:MAG: peptide-methionine (S)-S-oxide reductase MsrA [Pseudomonadota bacterium]|nr:peptide-methionine (S)-S-oxide reductase MsrA [Pseudomonadota bacterium]